MSAGADDETTLSTVDLQRIVEEFVAITELPQDPWEQLRMAIEAAYCAWPKPRIEAYRDARGIPRDLGVAVTVQAMVRLGIFHEA
jgi:pyruvate,orthophosphate dikinase